RMRIGSERDEAVQPAAKPQPVTPAAPPLQKPAPKKQPPKHYPPPNIRDRLSPELEAEYQAALGDLSLDALMSEGETGDAAESRVTGRVARIARDDVFVDLGGRNQGVVPLRQFDAPPKEGDQLELMVVRFDTEEGIYELSRPTAAIEVGNWGEVAEGQIIE